MTTKYAILKYYNDVLRDIENNVLNIKSTTNLQLNKFIKYIPGFLGAFPSNMVPKLKKMNHAYLIHKPVNKVVNTG